MNGGLLCKQSCQPTVHVPVLNCQKGAGSDYRLTAITMTFLYRPEKS